jgi:uncharacterized protein (DUF885 family)
MPRFIDTEIKTLGEGLREGYTLPRDNVSAVIQQLDDLLKLSPKDSPFSAVGKRDETPGFADAIQRIVGSEIVPALRRYRDFLRSDYLPRARSTTAVAALPNGEACYRASVRRYATVDMDATAVPLYAERVADEMGLYSSDLDRLGDLNEQALRAARLVVDSGLHVLGWSRQQAIDYMAAHLAYPLPYIESEVDRYIADPGQATAYMIGRLEIERLRKEAVEKLGNRFDVREFHDHVLENGSVPLTFLREYIERWIARSAT